MRAYRGVTQEEANELYRLYGDRSYALAQDLALIDAILPEEHRVLSDSETAAPEIPRFAYEIIDREDAWDDDYLEMILRNSRGMLGEQADLVKQVPFLFLPARRVNASVIRTRTGAFAILIDSDCFTILPHLVASYSAIDSWEGSTPLSRDFPQEEFAKTIVYLVAYVATGEPRYLRDIRTLGFLSSPDYISLIMTGTSPIHMFLVLHEYGHLLASSPENTLTKGGEKNYYARGCIATIDEEFAADCFAIEKLHDAGMPLKDIDAYVRLFLKFEELVELFRRKHGVEFIGRHPPARERLRNIEETLIGQLSEVSLRVNYWFQRLAEFSHLAPQEGAISETTEVPILIRECTYCARTVKDIGMITSKFPIITEDLSRDSGISCPKCLKFICLEECSRHLGNELERACPDCGTRLAAILPIEDITGDLAGNNLVDQASAVVSAVRRYGEQGEIRAGRIAYESLKHFAAYETDLAVFNEVTKAAVTLIIDAGAKEEFGLAQDLYYDVVSLSERFPTDRSMAHRHAEASLNLCTAYVHAERFPEAESIYLELQKIFSKWDKDPYIAKLVMITTCNLFAVKYKSGRSDECRLLADTIVDLCEVVPCDEFIEDTVARSIYITVSQSIEEKALDAALALFVKGERLATQWGGAQFRILHGQMGRELINAMATTRSPISADNIHDKLITFVERFPDDTDLRRSQVAASIDLQIAYSKVGNLEGERHIYNRLCELSHQHPSDLELGQSRLIAGLNLIRTLEERGERKSAIELMKDLRSWIDRQDKAALEGIFWSFAPSDLLDSI